MSLRRAHTVCWMLAGLSVTVAASMVGCGGDVDIAPSTAGGHGGASTSSSSASAGGAGAGGAGGGILSTGSGGDGCSGVGTCGPGLYCHDVWGTCFAQQEAGSCEDATRCSGEGPVCACDGSIYETDCAAFAAGVDLADTGCEAPADTFFCGHSLCTVGKQACFHSRGLAVYDLCEDFPPDCDAAQGGTPDCSCFSSCSCSQDAAGNVVVVCTGS